MDTNKRISLIKNHLWYVTIVGFLLILPVACDDMCLISLINRNAIQPVTLNKGDDYQYELNGNIWELSSYSCDCCSSGLKIRVDNQNSKVADVRVDENEVLRITARESGTSDVILFAYAYGPNNDVTDAIHFTVTVK